MYYSFKNAELKSGGYCLKAENITIETAEGKKENDARNDFVNGTHRIQGILDNECQPSDSKIRKNAIWQLKLEHERKHSLLDILFLDTLDIVPSRTLRRYTWLFFVVKKPMRDDIGFVAIKQGEVTIDDLLKEMGATRDEMNRTKKKFTSEGGFY